MEIVGSVVSGAGSSMLSCGRLVAVSEEFITTETFTVFLALGDLGRSEFNGAGRQFVD
jgi:hypothetical protein